MQLKSLAKTTEALNAIKESANITKKLKDIGRSYTKETLKAAMAQSTLNKQQIKTVLYVNGLRGEILKTTTAEVFNAASTNAMAASQKAAATSTLEFGTAVEGLRIKLNSLIATHPFLTAITAISAATYIAAKTIEYFNDSLTDVEKRIETNQSSLSEYTSKVEELTSKLKELNDIDMTYFSDNEKQKIETEKKYIQSEIDLYNRLVEAKQKVINQDLIKAAMGENETIAYKKLWSEITSGDWEGMNNTQNEISKINPLDFILPVGIGKFLKNVDDGNYFSEADKLFEEYKQLQDKYIGLENLAIYKNNKLLTEKVDETSAKMNQVAADIATYIEQISIARDALISSANSNDYTEEITKMDKAIEKYQSVLNGAIYESTYAGFSDLQRDLLGVRDAFNAIADSEGLKNSDIYDNVNKSINHLIYIINVLNTYSFSEIFEFDKILLTEALNHLKTSFEDLEKNFLNGEIFDAVKKKLSDTVSPEVIEGWEQLKTISGEVVTKLEEFISYISDETGITDLLDTLKVKIHNMLSPFLFLMGKWSELPGKAKTAWDEAHDFKYSDHSQNNSKDSEEESNINSIFSSFSDTDFGARIQHITDLFNKGSLSHKEYFDALQSEIDNFDASNFTNSIEDMNKASTQFFVDSMQQTANGLSTLINSFDKGEMSISEYLEGYLAVGNTLSTLTDNLQENSAAWDKNGKAISRVGNTALDDTQNKLNSSMSIIESYQDSIYSLEQIMNDAVTVGSDEFTAHANVIAEDLYNIVQTAGEMADTIAGSLGTTTSEIAKSLTENVSNQEIACQAIMANTNTAITNMAGSIGELFEELGNAMSDFKVDISFGIKSIDWKKVNVLGEEFSLPEIKFELGANGESLDKIGSAISSFGKTVASNYTPQTIELEDFHFGSTDAAKDRKYTPGSDIAKNYEDALDRIKASSSSEQSKFSETVDFFKRRTEELNNALSRLESNLENVTGSFAKNNLVDAELSITEEKFRNYSDALNMYSQKAEEALSKLPSGIAQKVKDGAVSLTDFIGDGNKDVVEAIKDYESWAGKVSDCTKELAELKKEIRQLELEKFNNIISDFSNQIDLRENSKDLISKQIDLLKEAGELIGESFYSKQIEQSQKQLHLLEAEKTRLVQQLNDALSSGHIQKGTDEWLEMVNALSDVDGNILDCKKSIEEFDNSILALHTEIFERIQSAFGNLSGEISNLIGLMKDSDVGSPDGSWTKEGLTQLGLYAQQYELAKYQVSQYVREIEKLNADYLNGRYSATEYADKLADLSSAQWDAVNAAESAKDAIVDLNTARVDIAVNAIQEQIDAYKELTDAQIKALQAEKDLHSYEKSLAEKEKDIAKLRKQIAAMQNDNSAATVAKRKQLEEQLAEALADLEETQYQHSIEAQEKALNQQYESYEEARNAEMEVLEDSLKDEEKLISDSLNAVRRNTETISNQIVQIARDHGIKVSNEIVNAWRSGENAIASYCEVLTAGTSAFVGQIQDAEHEIYTLQNDANATADIFSDLFSIKADNLVNELNASYNAVENLYNMTQALQDSLSSLGNGYEIDTVTGSLNDDDNPNPNPNTPIPPTTTEDTLPLPNPPKNQLAPAFSSVIQSDNSGKRDVSLDIIPIAYGEPDVDESKTVKPKKIVTESEGGSHKFTTTYYPYAEGTRNIPKDQLAVTNEDGQEIIYHAEDNSLLTRLSAGDKVFDNPSVNRLWEICHGNLPANISNMLPTLQQPIPFAVPSVVSSVNLPDRTNTLFNRDVNIHYDSLVTVHGDVNDTDHFIKQVTKIADQQITKSWKQFNDEFKY